MFTSYEGAEHRSAPAEVHLQGRAALIGVSVGDLPLRLLPGVSVVVTVVDPE